MHRHQFDGSYAEPLQVLDRGRVCETGVRPAHGRRHVWMPRGESLDVHLVDDRVAPGSRRPRVLAPRERIRNDDGLGHQRRGVAMVLMSVVFAGWIAEHRVVQHELTVESPRVGIDEQLAGVPPQALARVERAVDPEAVALPRAY